jgi:polysaccharide export outer membrane protein
MRLIELGLIALLPLLLAGGAGAAGPAPAKTTPSPAPTAPATAEPAAAATADDQGYILGLSDVIEVSVLGHPDFTTKGRIGEDGLIRLPFIGDVPAANKTAAQLGNDVAIALDKGGFFAKPIVKVDVSSFASRYVTVLGNLGSPGLVPVDRQYRLSEIIARVGGVKDSGADYVVFTPARGKQRNIAIAALATGNLNDDPYVSPGDKIYSPAADVFYISGQIKSPGAFPIIPGMTIRMAISRGGGLTDSGSDKHISVTRGGVKLKSAPLDSPIKSGDVIVIGERLF